VRFRQQLEFGDDRCGSGSDAAGSHDAGHIECGDDGTECHRGRCYDGRTGSRGR